MENQIKLSDRDIIAEIGRRLEEKDNSNRALVTLTKKLEGLNVKLMESEKLKSQFLSNIRNEINNPISSVLAMCELLDPAVGGMPAADVLTSGIETIQREALSLSFQLSNIFAAAELEAGEANPCINSVDVRALVNQTADSLRRRAAEKKVSIKVSFHGFDEGATFGTDAEKLALVLSNLLVNAIEFSNEGGEVDVAVRHETGSLSLVVSDNGIGIAPADHQRVFERFRQLETGSTKSHGGHGLGLSIVKAAAELLGGAVRLESEAGKGATFTVALPEATPVVAEEGVLSVDGNEFFFDGGEKF